MPKLTGFPSVSIPGPAPVPLLGHMPRVFQFLDDPIAVLDKLRKYGDLVALARDNPAMVCAFGPELNREVLSQPNIYLHDEDFINARPGTPLARVTEVLVAINGELHKRHRRLLMPAFAKSALDQRADEIVRVTHAMIDRWPLAEVADLDLLLRDAALCMVIRTLFGLDLLAEESDLGEIGGEFVEFLTSPLSIMLPIDLPPLPYHRTQQLAAKFVARLEQLIADKRRRGAGESDALSLLLHAVDDEGSKFTDAELISETSTLFVAGHETTAKTLTWTMFLLERHPAVLADLLDEIDAVLGQRSATAADLDNLPLLDRVIKESMRVLTPVPILFFRVPETAQQLGGVTLPAKSNIILSPHITHHDRDLYPQPRRFLPQRWETIKPTIYEYLPFGGGPRICIGAAFAQQAVRLMLATLLQRVRFSIVANAKIERLTRANILRPRHGLPVHLQSHHRRRLTPEPIRGNMHEMVELA
jgi:cytochrome P450